MKKYKSIISVLLVILLGLGISYLAVAYVKHELESLREKQFHQESVDLKRELVNLFDSKKKAAMSIPLLLSQDTVLKDFLENKSQLDLHQMFKKISNSLKENTDYHNVWIHIIDKNGISLGRSWIDKVGDSVYEARKDVREMIKSPHIMSTISTGKFSMTFKSMVPIFSDNNKFIGIVETVTHFNSIIDKLKDDGISSLILVDKKYKSQLTKPITKIFIDDYYVVNFTPEEKILNVVKSKGVDFFINNLDYKIFDNYLTATYFVKDFHGNNMGYFILFKDKSSIDNSEINNFLNSIKNIILGALFILLMLFIVFYKIKSNVDKQRIYFKQILDSESDIIIVTNAEQPIDVNKAFFDFFADFKTLEDFDKTHGCICNMFEEREGFLNKTMGEITWIEYIMAHPNSEHKVQITNKGQTYFFSVKVQRLNEVNENIFTLVLTDITQMEVYKDKLEKLSKTDALTSIGNREYFNQNIIREMNRAKRYQHPLSLLMFDLDFFKNVNDNYGHDVGDVVLVQITKVVQHLLRNTDLFCRYGGEEFMVIMPESSLIEASISAERIRSHIQQLKIRPIETITVSIGLTQFKDDDNIDSFVKRVDNALYKSKNNGRNRVTSI